MKSLRQKLEEAFKVYLSQTIDTGVYTGLGSFNVKFPAVVASYLTGEEIHPQAHHIKAEILISVISSADDETVEDADKKHNELFGKVVEACETEDLSSDLMAAGDALIVNGIIQTTEEQPDVESDEAGQPIFKSGYTVVLTAGHN